MIPLTPQLLNKLLSYNATWNESQSHRGFFVHRFSKRNMCCVFLDSKNFRLYEEAPGYFIGPEISEKLFLKLLKLDKLKQFD